jgi:type IV pilus assembly protein PilN
MIKLIQINLLPYREEAKKAQQKQFTQILALAGVVGVGLAVLGYLGLAQAISSQDDRNNYLQTEITNLDAQIKKVKLLNEEKKNFMARKQKVEELQNQRFVAAQILNDFNRLLPDGMYLTELKSDGPTGYSIKGKANSDNKVALFMKSLPSTGVFGTAELDSIKKETDAQSFTLKAPLAPKNKQVDEANPAEGGN